MKVYVYQAALLCESCGEKCRFELTAKGFAPTNPDDDRTYDSNNFPKGPVDEDESDSPSHCDRCHLFLKSPLTSEGVDCVLESVAMFIGGECGGSDVVATWVAYYEGRDDRVTLAALANSAGVTLADIMTALRAKDHDIECLTERVRQWEVSEG